MEHWIAPSVKREDRIGWIDALIDPDRNPHQRAWLLALLFAATGQHDPRPESPILTALGDHKIFGPRGRSSMRSKINLELQQKFVEKWRTWKEDGYYTVNE